MEERASVVYWVDVSPAGFNIRPVSVGALSLHMYEMGDFNGRGINLESVRRGSVCMEKVDRVWPRTRHHRLPPFGGSCCVRISV